MIRNLLGLLMILLGVITFIFTVMDGKANSADAIGIALFITGFITLSSFRREA